MRYLAIDLGDKRTGLAAGDDVTGIVSPVKVVQQARGPALDAAILKEIAEHGPDAIVIGLPLNMDGTEGPSARAARRFGESISRQASIAVHFQDERLSSFAAEEYLHQSGRTHKEKRELRDALAAAEILRDYLSRAI